MDDFQELVYSRLRAMPDGIEISIGDKGAIKKTDLLKHIKKNDEIGQELIRIEREFFNALKSGEFYRQ
jgi:hypothetical protein